MTKRQVATREQWLTARRELLEREKELTRRSDELARERERLPWVRVDEPYRFATGDGTKTLAELFEDRSQLLVYHLMFGPEDTVPCLGCSYTADNLDGAAFHLAPPRMAGVDLRQTELHGLSAFALEDDVV
jgi:predicted dithiol-disulfide oxidoreductase (DUF899 family)